jgi:hypothetical protein
LAEAKAIDIYLGQKLLSGSSDSDSPTWVGENTVLHTRKYFAVSPFQPKSEDSSLFATRSDLGRRMGVTHYACTHSVQVIKFLKLKVIKRIQVYLLYNLTTFYFTNCMLCMRCARTFLTPTKVGAHPSNTNRSHYSKTPRA